MYVILLSSTSSHVRTVRRLFHAHAMSPAAERSMRHGLLTSECVLHFQRTNRLGTFFVSLGMCLLRIHVLTTMI